MINRYRDCPRILRIAGLSVPLLLLLSAPAIGQETTTPDTAPPAAGVNTDAELSAADIAKRADEIDSKLQEIQNSLQSDPAEVTAIPGQVDKLQIGLQAQLKVLNSADLVDLNLADFETLQQTFRRMARQLDAWGAGLQEHADQLDQDIRFMKLQAKFFDSVLKEQNREDLPEALLDRVKTLTNNLDNSQVAVRARLDRALAELTRISSIKLQLSDASQILASGQKRRELAAFAIDRAPIWKAKTADDRWPDRLSRDLRSRRASVREFSGANEGGILAMFVLLIFIVVILLTARPAIMHRAEESATDLARRPLIERPISLALLLWAFVGPQVFLPSLPLALIVVRGLVVVVALWRMLPVVNPAAEKRHVTGLLVLFALSLLVEIYPASDLSDRLIWLTIGAFGLYFFIGFRRSLTDTPKTERDLWWTIGFVNATLAPYIFGVALAGILVGAVSFAEHTIVTLLSLNVAILAIVVVERFLTGLASFFVSAWGQRSLRSIRRYPDKARHRLRMLIRLAMIGIFLSILPRISQLAALLSDWLIGISTTEISIGMVEMSIAHVVYLLVSLVIAIFVAKFIRFTLDEDVFPRLPIATGAAAAASRLIYYAIVAGGILFALAASGVELSKLTLLISALGVGIGFGLQGIVNNFVSGLVLAFERPFQVGDIIEIETLVGRVREIGLRASRVRTFDGAEVIVPNADLIAGNVINWTLSDRMRRLDLKVGVAYGTDPGRVREILRKVGDDCDAVAKDPETTALFNGFGDSSLNFTLRAWIPEAGDWPQIASDLNEAINAAFNEAGIEIPFPQRTLHIKSDERTD